MDLSNIQFYQACKVKRRGKIIKQRGRKWDVTKTTEFLEKVKVIRMRAEIINQKLINY